MSWFHGSSAVGTYQTAWAMGRYASSGATKAGRRRPARTIDRQ